MLYAIWTQFSVFLVCHSRLIFPVGLIKYLPLAPEPLARLVRRFIQWIDHVIYLT